MKIRKATDLQKMKSVCLNMNPNHHVDRLTILIIIQANISKDKANIISFQRNSTQLILFHSVYHAIFSLFFSLFVNYKE